MLYNNPALTVFPEEAPSMDRRIIWHGLLVFLMIGTAATSSRAQVGVTETDCHSYAWLKNATVDQLKECGAHHYEAGDVQTPAGVGQTNCQDYAWLKNATVQQLKECGSHDYEASDLSIPTEPTVQKANQQPSLTETVPMQTNLDGGSVCRKNISFAMAFGGSVAAAVPGFAGKWVSKNSKRYPGICFVQLPVKAATNYVLVFAKFLWFV